MTPHFTKKWKTTRTPATWCPCCFHTLTATTCTTGEHSPEPGDYTICINCGEVLRWNDRMDLDQSSLMEIPEDSRMRFAQVVQVIKGLTASKPEKPKPWEVQ